MKQSLWYSFQNLGFGALVAQYINNLKIKKQLLILKDMHKS